MVLKSPYERTATWDVTLLSAARKAAWARASMGIRGTSPGCLHHPLPRCYLWSICSPSRYRIGYVALLACSDSPTPSGGETGSIQLSDPLPAEALLCSGDLRRAMGRCNRFIATSSVSAQQLGVGRGRRTKIAFLQQGKKPNLPHPCGLTVPFNASRRKSAAWAFFCTAGVQSRTEPRRGPDFQAAGQPAAAPNTAAQEGQRDQPWDLLAQPKCPWLAGTRSLWRAATLTLWGHGF